MEKVFPEALQSLKSADPLIYQLIQKEKLRREREHVLEAYVLRR